MKHQLSIEDMEFNSRSVVTQTDATCSLEQNCRVLNTLAGAADGGLTGEAPLK